MASIGYARGSLAVAVICSVMACSATEQRTPPGGSSGSTGSGGAGSGGFDTMPGTGAGTGIVVDGGGTPIGPCTEGGWACKVEACEGQPKTTVRARIYDPAGLVPLYNVAVYVPNTTLADIPTGPRCETCATPVSGNPVASALTNSSGEFLMEDVPVGTDVPLVIQIGKWRRQISLPEVRACQENVFDDPNLFRLPREQSEGHLPRIAMMTGEADSLECLLRRIGVADSEFTNPEGTGRVNLFVDDLGTGDEPGTSAYASGGTFPPASQLLASTESISQYDIVLMSCQGSESAGREKLTSHKQALKSFVDSGGRAFLEHYHYSLLRGGTESLEIEEERKYPMTPFPAIAVWQDPVSGDYAPGGDGSYSVDVSFPKGNDFADWLVNVGASTTRASIDLIEVKNPATSALPVAQRWIYQDGMGTPYLSANTPIEQAATPDLQCGRLVHTGIHVAKVTMDTSDPFPNGCQPGTLSPQEKAMEFLFFDLSSCVMNERTPPKPPAVIE